MAVWPSRSLRDQFARGAAPERRASRTSFLQGVSYPILVREPGSEVDGVVVGGLTKRDVERLSAFEGPRYRIGPLKVRVGGSPQAKTANQNTEARTPPLVRSSVGDHDSLGRRRGASASVPAAILSTTS